jgi:hypothetical protein
MQSVAVRIISSVEAYSSPKFRKTIDADPEISLTECSNIFEGKTDTWIFRYAFNVSSAAIERGS